MHEFHTHSSSCGMFKLLWHAHANSTIRLRTVASFAQHRRRPGEIRATFTPLACGPISPESSKTYSDMASQLFMFIFCIVSPTDTNLRPGSTSHQQIKQSGMFFLFLVTLPCRRLFGMSQDI